jgi:ferredoxin--NADP+ reductase
LKPVASDEFEDLPVDLVFRSIGYRGVPLDGLPFDEWSGTIPNDEGRVLDDGNPVPGVYVAGWIKRGPTGVIGTNKPDSAETVNRMLEDVASGTVLDPKASGREDVAETVRAAQPDFISYDDWHKIDALETKAGEETGRPRVKFTDVEDVLAALRG